MKTYWTGGTTGLYRLTGGPDEFTSPERWDGTGWQPDSEFLGRLLDGDMGLDETPAAEAADRFPAAFA